MDHVHAVILAGGGGTRLWPLSRRRRPKHLLPLAGAAESLLAGTAGRFEPVAGASRTWVVTAADQADAVRAELPQVPADQILVEPVGRNTGAAVGLAALHAVRRDARAVLAVSPADHHVRDLPAFRAVVEKAADAAAQGRVVTVGIRPAKPETGFGYIEVGDQSAPGVFRSLGFREKPDRARAEEYLAGGRHLWNSGMFFFQAVRILEEIERHMPELARALNELGRALDVGDAAQAATRLWPTLPPVSIDYGVMEKIAELYVVPGDFGWSDVGSFAAMGEVRAADPHGNIVAADAVLLGAADNVIAADGRVTIALIGVSDLIVAATPDAVLVAPKSRAQDVRDVVVELQKRKRDELV